MTTKPCSSSSPKVSNSSTETSDTALRNPARSACVSENRRPSRLMANVARRGNPPSIFRGGVIASTGKLSDAVKSTSAVLPRMITPLDSAVVDASREEFAITETMKWSAFGVRTSFRLCFTFGLANSPPLRCEQHTVFGCFGCFIPDSQKR